MHFDSEDCGFMHHPPPLSSCVYQREKKTHLCKCFVDEVHSAGHCDQFVLRSGTSLISTNLSEPDAILKSFCLSIDRRDLKIFVPLHYNIVR